MASMTIKTFVSVASNLPGDITVLLRGNHGIGKSQIVRKLAAQLGFSQEDVIDRRLSQMSDGDMIGLPSTDGECTRFNPPNWYLSACKSPKVLFLDELNRATPEVMQAAFQIVLDRELNGWKLHPGTRVFSAINSSASYNVNEVDPALLDRFWVIDLEPSVEDWLTWARDTDTTTGGNIAPVVVDFIVQGEKWLDPAKNAEPGSIQPSRRSWERLSKSLISAKVDDNPTSALFYGLCLGFVGTETSIAFVEFAKNVDTRLTGEEIVNSYKKVLPKIKRLNQEAMNGAIEKMATYVTNELDELTPEQGANVKAFMENLSNELRLSCWQKLIVKGVEKVDLAKSIHKYCSEAVLNIFGVTSAATVAGAATPTTATTTATTNPTPKKRGRPAKVK